MKAEKTLVGEKVTLRKMEKIDMVHAIEFAEHTEKVMKYLYMNWKGTTPEKQLELLKIWNKSKENRPMAIDENATGEHIGNCDLRLDLGNKRAHLGIVIGVPEAQGKGYGTEVITILRDYAFKEFDIQRVELCVETENERGVKTYEKCGLKKEGMLRGYYFKKWKNKQVDMWMMSIMRSEWEKLTKKGKNLAYKF